MLDTLDLSVRLDKADYKRRMDSLGLELEYLQREARTHRVPLLLLFEGWDAAGKGDSIATMVQHLDPRGFKVNVFAAPTDEERFRPYPYRYSVRLPARGFCFKCIFHEEVFSWILPRSSPHRTAFPWPGAERGRIHEKTSS